MRVAVYYNNRDVRIEERKIPEIGDCELLVKVISSGICGSDVMEWYRIKKAPLVLGHEIAGIVEKAGLNVKGFKAGDRVFVSHHVPCMQCIYCLNGNHTACETLHRTNFDPGGFSEYIRIPELNVKIGTFRLPENVSFDEGTFIEPLGCVLRAQRIAGLKKCHTLLVIGSGMSGIMHINAAKLKGVRKIIAVDLNDYRLNAAKRFGADHSINASQEVQSKVKELNEGRLADIVIVCTGALAACNQALKCADKGGAILFFAVPKPDEKLEIPINEFWRNEIKMMTSYGASPYDLKDSIRLISSGRLKLTGMITHRLKFEDIGKGFQLVADAKESLKVIVEPNSK